MEYLYVAIPKDIDEYEKKFFIGLTARQLTWVTIAAVVGLSIFLICNYFGLSDLGLILCFVSGILIFSIGGFKQIHGRPYSSFVKAAIKYYRSDQKLLYRKDIDFIRKEEGNVRKKKQSRKVRKEHQRLCKETTEW
ncbi:MULTISPECIES: PrgI family protein [Erysipelotrichaceae]|uniref:PrgI family protein n=1 Tax=Erysipelotrichaceae TaxID=128827 RepID=UPI00259BED16|nr:MULTISPECIES: PrgI family protein [Erysipelotrichaceae]